MSAAYFETCVKIKWIARGMEIYIYIIYNIYVLYIYYI